MTIRDAHPDSLDMTYLDKYSDVLYVSLGVIRLKESHSFCVHLYGELVQNNLFHACLDEQTKQRRLAETRKINRPDENGSIAFRLTYRFHSLFLVYFQ